MTTSALASQSPDRMAQVHKANQPKSGQQTPQTPANNFAALLLMADATEQAADGALVPTNPIDQAGDPLSTDNPPDSQADDTEASLPPGQLALLGLMDWQNFALPKSSASAAPAVTTATATATSSLPEAGTATPPSALSMLPAPTTAAVNSPAALPGNGLTDPASNAMALGTMQPADEAATAEVLAALRAASPDAANAANTAGQPAKAGAAAGLVPPPGSKPKPGSLRHALATSQSTASTSPPSTVSLAQKTTGVDAPTSNPAQLVAAPRAGAATDAPTSAKDAPLATDLVNSAAAATRPQEPANGPQGPFFAAAMDAPGLDAAGAAPPDMPALPTPESMEQTMEQLGAHIAYWAAQGNQRASLTIGGQHNNPLGVNISFENGEVHVHFETDEAEVKEALSLSAADMLHQMLEAKGMALGDVSIGAGQSGQRFTGQPNADAQRENQTTNNSASTTRTQPSAVQGTGASGPAGRAPNLITATKLDFFA